MKPGRGSRTAEGAAAFRASHTLYDDKPVFRDPFAIALTSPRWRRVLKSRVLHWLVVQRYLRDLRPVVAQVVGRARYAEDCLNEAIVHGVGQYVIVGAGLDSFALRRPELAARLRVFEVDHPNTQALKQRRVAEARARVPLNLEFVAVDFEKESIAQALWRSTYKADQPAFFSWLGTTHYLTTDATLGTLQAIASIAAPGSKLVFDYSLPRELLPEAALRVGKRLSKIVSHQTEPFLGRFKPEHLHAQVEAMEWQIVEDLSGEEQQRRYFAGRTDGLVPTGGTHFLHLRRV
jgi:methyltransferase (TIGR00027 family)